MSPGTAPFRIALIEDDTHMATMLRYNIEAAGHVVDWIDNGADAIDLVRDKCPDLVVLDWMLPGLSGIEIVRRLRATHPTKRVPVMMLTARTEPADRRRACDVGVDLFLTKPFSVASFLEKLTVLLARSQKSDFPADGPVAT